MIVATSQVASTVANLKARYYGYLDSLCTANGIDIGTLKTQGGDYEELEMFFGGLPVLIGLKYFERLRVLRLFGQDVVNLKPLVEVANTLEELWVCEGPLKDLTGIDVCKRLQRAYLYDCQIEQGHPLEKVTTLNLLMLQNNRLKDLSFLTALNQLTVLHVGGTQFDDSAALSVQTWPAKIQELDLGGNRVKSLQCLLPLSSCEVVRSLTLVPEPSLASTATNSTTTTEEERVRFAWTAFHFPFLERLNGDRVTERFQPVYSSRAEFALTDAYVNLIKAEKTHQQQILHVERNCTRVQDRLQGLVAILSKLVLTVPKKEGRRELVLRIQEQSLKSLRELKKLKRQCIQFETVLHRLRDYYFPSWRLEGGLSTSWPRALEDYETRLLEHHINTFNGRSSEHCVKLKAGFAFETVPKQLRRTEVEKLFFLDPSRRSMLWELRSWASLCDRRLTRDFREDPVRVFKDVALSLADAKEGTRFLLLPMVFCEKHARKFRYGGKGDNDSLQPSGDLDNEGIATKGQMESALWSELELALLLLVEIQATGQMVFEDVQNPAVFEEKLSAQVKHLKNLGIDLKLDKSTSVPEAAAESQMNDLPEDASALETKKGKTKKFEEWATTELTADRWRRRWALHGSRRLTLRNPLELTLSFARPPLFIDYMDFCTTVTCLDLAGAKLTKLDGIEQLTNVSCLNLAKNKLISAKKLKCLANLVYLDLSANNLAHFDDPPEALLELVLCENRLVSLAFCAKLPLLCKLNVSGNRCRSLRGLEGCKALDTLRLSDNQVKERLELEVLGAFPKLAVLDLSGNAVTEQPEYRRKVLARCPSLLVVDCELVPADEKSSASRKAGKALTLEFIEKTLPNFAFLKNMNLRGHEFQTVALDKASIAQLQHVTQLDLADNRLEGLHELSELENLLTLDLARNSILSLSNLSSTSGRPDQKILVKLSELDLTMNSLTNQTLPRLGLSNLPSLRKLILVGNQLSKFDMALFDLPSLEELDLSQNDLRQIRKKTLTQLKVLILRSNKLKDLDGLATPNLVHLDARDNKITTCAALKPLALMPKLQRLQCLGNAVTERRVYGEFIRNQLRNLEFLDDDSVRPMNEAATSASPMPETMTESEFSLLSFSQIEQRSSARTPSNSSSNGILIAPRSTQKSAATAFPSRWQAPPAKSVRNGKRPAFCPPGTTIIVNDRIARSATCFTLFPEGHYTSADGSLGSSVASSRNDSVDGRLPMLRSAPAPRGPTTTRKLRLPPIGRGSDSDLFLTGQRLLKHTH